MARNPKPTVLEIIYSSLHNKKAVCSFCGQTVSKWHCPSCGLPVSSQYRKRPEYASFDNFQLCSECNTSNPYDSKFCRNCGRDISQQAKDKDGHGWIDLGLSVLWSTESISGYYYWMDTKDITGYNTRAHKSSSNYRQEDDLQCRILAGKDTAAYIWGHKWRMPTKEEFEELIEKCSFELVEIPHETPRFEKTTINAIKVTGPNGNHIYLPALGSVSGSYSEQWGSSYFRWLPKYDDFGFDFLYWSSSKGEYDRIPTAYAFCARLESMKHVVSLSTPVDMKIKRVIRKHFIRHLDYNAYSVRPVADKKWKGKL